MIVILTFYSMKSLNRQKLETFFSKEGLDQAFKIADMQELIFCVETDNIESIRDELMKTIYVRDEFYIKRLVENIIISCKIRGHRVFNYVSLLHGIYESPMMEKKEYLKKCIFEIHQSGCLQPYRLLLIRGCMYLFDEDEIYSYVQKYLRKFETVDDEQMNIFVYFAPYIEKHDKPIYDNILNEMKKRRVQMKLPLIYHPFIDQFDELRENNWELHKVAIIDGFTSNCLIYSIRHDEFEMFLEFAKKENFDPNQRVPESILLRYNALMNKMTILEWASFHGARKAFDYLLEHGADPNLTDELGLDLMHFSVLGGHHYMIKRCQELGFRFDNGAAPFIAEFYRFDLFKWAYDQNLFKLDKKFPTIGTVFHRAAASNNIVILLFCIEHGIDINIRDNFDITALYYAVKNISLDAINLFLSHKSLILNATDKFLDTPLHGAAKYGDVEIFKTLLTHKDANLNIVDIHHRTPLITACSFSKPEIVECCLGYPEIDYNKTDDSDYVPLFFACEVGSIDCFKIIISKAKKNSIHLELNIPRKEDKFTMLHYCAMNNQTTFIEILLQEDDINPNLLSEDGMAPLHIASKLGYTKVIRLLASNPKTDLNIKSSFGFTPLHIAVKNAQKEAVIALLESNRINVNITSRAWLLPIDYAKELGFYDIVEVFQQFQT